MGFIGFAYVFRRMKICRAGANGLEAATAGILSARVHAPAWSPGNRVSDKVGLTESESSEEDARGLV
jgi:hypothetical protein